ncbi:uncharacterized protein PSANT_02742 [Moesziomyces antarcticus]|nr:uncharacterized protein PSANT_02742 [Moesziomyces antarcticus]
MKLYSMDSKNCIGARMVSVLVLCMAAFASLASALRSDGPLRLDRRQAPNQMSITYPTAQTGSFNMTTFTIPIPLGDAYSLASPYNLILNHGLPGSVIPTGTFPLQIVVGYFYDIRQRVVLGLLPLQVQQLSVVEVYLPFIDVLGTGKPFRRSVSTYMDQLIPALVGGLSQLHNTQLAYFDPPHAAYKAAGGSTLSFQAGQGLVNSIDGPGLVSPVVQTVFERTTSSPISAAAFRAMLDQPYYTTAGSGCNTATLYYNYSNANPSFVRGEVQTYAPITSTNTDYQDAVGYTAATQWVSPSNLAACSSFA